MKIKSFLVIVFVLFLAVLTIVIIKNRIYFQKNGNNIDTIDSNGDAWEYISRGTELAREEKYKEAFIYYKKALVIDPNNINAKYFLGLTMVYAYHDKSKRNTELGLNYIKESIDNNGPHIFDRQTALLFYAQSLVMAEDYPLAMKYYRMILKVNPKNEMAHRELRQLYEKVININDR